MGHERPGASGERSLFALAWPLVISFWVRAALTWVDRVYAAHIEGYGDASQAAIGLTQPFEFLMIAAWVGTSNALTSRLAQAVGAGHSARIRQWKEASRVLVRALVGAFVLVAIAIWFGAEHVGLDADVARQFRLYAAILVGGSAFTMFWSILPDSIVKAHQDTRTTMWSGILSSVLNVLLNTLFVFGFGWGIVGLAVGTVLARLGGYLFARAMAERHERRRLAEAPPDVGAPIARPVMALLAIAIPSGLTYVLMAAEGFAINGLLATSPDDREVLAAWSVWDAALRLMAMPAIAVGVAVLPLAARRRARGDLGGLVRELRTGVLLVVVYTLLLVWPATVLLGDTVARGLLDSAPAIAYLRSALDVMPWALLGLAPVFVLRPVFDALGHSRRGLALSTIRSLVFIVPAAWIGGEIGLALADDRVTGFAAGLGVGAALGSLLVGVGLARTLREAPSQPPSASAL